MRTLLEVKTEIISLREECKSDGIKKSYLNRKKKRIEFLQQVEAYLETAPEELYLSSEINRLENKISALMGRIPSNLIKSDKIKLEGEYGIKRLRTQVRTLRFIKK